MANPSRFEELTRSFTDAAPAPSKVDALAGTFTDAPAEPDYATQGIDLGPLGKLGGDQRSGIQKGLDLYREQNPAPPKPPPPTMRQLSGDSGKLPTPLGPIPVARELPPLTDEGRKVRESVAVERRVPVADLDPEVGREIHKGLIATGPGKPPEEVDRYDSRYQAQVEQKIGAPSDGVGDGGEAIPTNTLRSKEYKERYDAHFAAPNEYGALSKPTTGEELAQLPFTAPLGVADALHRKMGGEGFLPERAQNVGVGLGRAAVAAPGAALDWYGDLRKGWKEREDQIGAWDAIGERLRGKEEIGNAWAGESLAQGDGLWDSLKIGAGKLKDEAIGLATMPLHIIGEAAKLGDNSKPPEERVKGTLDSVANVAQMVTGGLIEQVADPRAGLEKGLITAAANVAPVGQATKLLGRTAEAVAGRPLGPKPLGRLAADEAALTEQVGTLAAEGQNKLKAVRATEREANLARDAVEDAKVGPAPNLPDVVQAEAKAAQALDEARASLAQFDEVQRPVLEQAVQKRKAVERELWQGRGKHAVANTVSRLPSALASGGVTAMTDAARILAGRLIDERGRGGIRYLLHAPSERLTSELLAIKREMGGYIRSADIARHEILRSIPEKHQPTVQMMMEAEATIPEGGWFQPGNSYARHIVEYQDGAFRVSKFGEQWVAQKQSEANRAVRESARLRDQMTGATRNPALDEALSAAEATYRDTTSLLQKLEADVEIANRYAKPLVERIAKVTEEAKELGLLTDFDLPAWQAARAAGRESATGARDRAVGAAEREYQVAVTKAQKSGGRELDAVALIARRVLEEQQAGRSSLGLAADRRTIRDADWAGATGEAARKRTVDRLSQTFTDTQRAAARADAAAGRGAPQPAPTLRQGEGAPRIELPPEPPMSAQARRIDAAAARERARGLKRAERVAQQDIRASIRQQDRDLGRAWDEGQAQKATVGRVFDRGDRTVQRVADDRRRKAESAVAKELQRLGMKRERAVAAAEQAFQAEVGRIDRQVPPQGLRRTYLPQVYDQDFRRARKESQRTSDPMEAYQTGGAVDNKTPLKLDPYLDASRLKQNKLREGRVPVSRRVEDYGYKRDLESAVMTGVAALEHDVAVMRQYRAIAADPKLSMTKEQFDAARAAWIERHNATAPPRKQIDKNRALKVKTPLDEGWMQVPNDARFVKYADDGKVIEGPKTYGDLAGKFVPEDVWYDLVNGRQLAEQMASWLPRLQSTWKGLKVLNPATMNRNGLTNAVLFAPMAGFSLLNPKNLADLGRGFVALMRGHRSPEWRRFHAGGLYGGGYAKSELAREIVGRELDGAFSSVPAFFQAITRMGHGIGKGGKALFTEGPARAAERGVKERLRTLEPDGPAWVAERAANPAPTAGKHLKEAGKQAVTAAKAITWDLAGQVYSLLDDVFRTGLALKLERQGKTLAEAVDAGRKAFLDYEDVAGWVQIARAPFSPVLTGSGKPIAGTKAVWVLAGQPFIAYPSRAIPRVKQWIVENPIQANTWLAMHDYLTGLNLSLAGLDADEVQAHIDLLAPWERLTSMPMGAFHPSLAKDEEGNTRLWNAGYLNFAGQLMDNNSSIFDSEIQDAQKFGRGTLGLDLNPMIGPIVDLSRNRDSFTGQEIVKDTMWSDEGLASLWSHIIRNYGHTLTPALSDVASGDMGAGIGSDTARFGGGYGWEKWSAADEQAPDLRGRERDADAARLEVLGGTKNFVSTIDKAVLDRLAEMGWKWSDARGLARTGSGVRVTPADMTPDELYDYAADLRPRLEKQLLILEEKLAEAEQTDLVTKVRSGIERVLSQEDDARFIKKAERFIRKWTGELGEERSRERRDATDLLRGGE